MIDFDIGLFEKHQNEIRMLYGDVKIPREFWKRRRRTVMTPERRMKVCSEIARMAEMEVGGDE